MPRTAKVVAEVTNQSSKNSESARDSTLDVTKIAKVGSVLSPNAFQRVARTTLKVVARFSFAQDHDDGLKESSKTFTHNIAKVFNLNAIMSPRVNHDGGQKVKNDGQKNESGSKGASGNNNSCQGQNRRDSTRGGQGQNRRESFKGGQGQNRRGTSREVGSGSKRRSLSAPPDSKYESPTHIIKYTTN